MHNIKVKSVPSTCEVGLSHCRIKEYWYILYNSHHWEPTLQLSIVCIQLGMQKPSVIQNNRVSAIQGLLKYWSEWKDSQDF